MKRLTKWLWQIWFKLKNKVRGIPPPLHTVYVAEMPNELEKDQIYLIGENNHFWFAALLCPCGCETTVQVSLLSNSTPHWTFVEHNDGTISLSPSVWRKDGCLSHYHVRHGIVEWV